MTNSNTRMTNLFRVLAIVATLTTLPGCFPLVATGIGAAVLVADDRRTTGAILDDETIENKALIRIQQRHAEAHVNVTSFNRIVLITGEARNSEIRSDIERIVREVENVRSVQNEMSVAQTSTLMLRGNDTVQTSKVKTRFVEANTFRANHVKVVTENGIVYLMGLVKRQEAQDAADIARSTGGVQRVVRIFEYTD